MNRRAIAILGAIFLLIVGALGFLLYQRQHNSKVASENQQQNSQPSTPENPTPPLVPTNTAPQEPSEPTDASKATKLSDDQILSPVLFYQGNGITYFNSQGQLFQTDLQNSGGKVLLSNKRELTIALKSGISRILWPQSGNNFIAEFGSGTSRSWSFYDSSKGLYADLPKGIVALDWLPSSDRIMFIYVDNTGKATLNTSNPDGSDYKTITDMYEGDDDFKLSPNGTALLFWRTQNRDATNIVNYLSKDGENYKALVKDGYNVGVKWAPDSNKFVFARRDAQSQTYQLWVADATTGTVKNLNVNTTPDKVVWTSSSNYVFAAVPKGSSGSSLTEDSIFKINAVSADKTEIDPGSGIDAEDLFLDSTENILFFKNAQDRALYYLDVSQ